MYFIFFPHRTSLNFTRYSRLVFRSTHLAHNNTNSKEFAIIPQFISRLSLHVVDGFVEIHICVLLSAKTR